DIGEQFKNPKKTGVIITDNPQKLFAEEEVHAAVITTTSHLESIYSQLTQCLDSGVNVISTCEELSYPWKKNESLAKKIDAHAKKSGVTVVGTGINPGYLMDTLPLILTAPCIKVESVKVVRMMNSAKRRIPFVKKVGTGLTTEEFKKKIETGEITGHVGLLESIALIADCLGFELDEAEELPPEPVIAKKATETPLGTVKEGKVVGLISRAYGMQNKKRIIVLEFVAHASVADEYDEVLIDGEPPIHQRVIGGVHGDIGTVGMTINTIPRAVSSEPGLKLMNELCLVSFVP
ncbi:MAG: dihydrodipicolinate reductase, partial [Spirochaetota bacterium]